MKRNLRPLTLASGIITTILAILLFVTSYFVFVDFSQSMQGDNNVALIFTFGIILILYLVVAGIVFIGGVIDLILGITTIRVAIKGDEVYAKKRGRITAGIVYDIIATALYFFGFMTFLEMQGASRVLFAIIIIGTLLSIVLKIVDRVLFAKSIKSNSASSILPRSEETLAKDLDTALATAQNLKNDGVISEVDYMSLVNNAWSEYKRAGGVREQPHE